MDFEYEIRYNGLESKLSEIVEKKDQFYLWGCMRTLLEIIPIRFGREKMESLENFTRQILYNEEISS